MCIRDRSFAVDPQNRSHDRSQHRRHYRPHCRGLRRAPGREMLPRPEGDARTPSGHVQRLYQLLLRPEGLRRFCHT
eukprot:3712069-Pyramimonas_sp.AAC.1